MCQGQTVGLTAQSVPLSALSKPQQCREASSDSRLDMQAFVIGSRTHHYRGGSRQGGTEPGPCPLPGSCGAGLSDRWNHLDRRDLSAQRSEVLLGPYPAGSDTRDLPATAPEQGSPWRLIPRRI